MENLIYAKSETPNNAGVTSESNLFEAVRGISHAGDFHGAVVGINDNNTDKAGPGVYGKSRGAGVIGLSETWHAVAGTTQSTTGGVGVYGKGKGSGVLGEGETWHAVAGITQSTTGGAGVYGKGKGTGVLGEGETWHAVAGISQSTTGGAGVYGLGITGILGESKNGIGVFGKSESGEGMHAETSSTKTAALAAYQMNAGSKTAALYAKHHGGGAAGIFEGTVHVSGKLVAQGIDLPASIQDIKNRLAGIASAADIADLKNRVKSIETYITDALALKLLNIENKVRNIETWISSQA